MPATPLYEKILLSEHDELVSMAELRNIDSTLSDQELRNRLLAYEGYDENSNTLKSDDEGNYTVNIKSADNVRTISRSKILFTGNVEITFLIKGSDNERSLYSKSLIVDSENKTITAYGDVRFKDESLDNGLGNMDAEIVTFLWEKGDLIVTGGTSFSQRENSDGETVNFYNYGDTLVYNAGEKGLFFKDGYITSNPQRQYSSIKAKKIAFLEGGDMFLSSATLNIGRVPIFYFPYFFYPGSRLNGNPAFGLNSDRGMFLSLTFDVLGEYPKISEAEGSSFSAILRDKNAKSNRNNGVYYEESLKPNTGLALWAEKSESYVTLLMDAYERTGFDVGTDSLLKLFNKKLTISTNSMLVYSNQKYNDTNRRFFSVNEFKFTSKYFNLTGLVPFYSDPYVLKDYGNRLTSFSIDSIFGLSQSFPATYSSNITTYTTSINGSLSIPVKKIWFLDKLDVTSFNMSSKSTWKSNLQQYKQTNIVYPDINIKASGTIFGFSRTKNKEEKETVENEKEEFKLSEYFILSDPLLYPLYENEIKKKSTTSTTSSLKLTYTAYEQFKRTYEEYLSGNFSGETTVNKLGSTLTLAGVAENLFTVTSTITPSYSYTYYEESNHQKTDIVSFNNNNKITIPKLGITWFINSQLYRYKKINDDNNGVIETTERFGWDKESVKEHYVSLSKSFERGDFTFTPGLKYIMDPLDGIITPSLSIKYKKFTSAFDYKIVEDTDQNKYIGKTMNLSLGFLGTYFTSSFKAIYERDQFDASDPFAPFSFKSSASLRNKDKTYSITEYFDFDADDNGVKNEVEALKTYIVTPNLLFTHNFKTIEEVLKTDYSEVKLYKDNVLKYWWKNRIVFSGNISALFHYDYNNPYNIYSSLTTKLTFSVAEFLDINFSFVTKNNGYYRYKKDGEFFKNMFEDLMRSFDIFGSGVKSTQFIMDSISLELIHYMSDWNLHFKYTASVVSTSSGYSWVPVVTVYLKWKTLPDLKVDQNWRKYEGNWESTESVYGKK
ncbi:MAG: hypothetical protein K6G51_08390 [Sphaerochaetaceae bacterium]|nr:hypothetical protein [Sphaerochaetaceae bacterium]